MTFVTLTALVALESSGQPFVDQTVQYVRRIPVDLRGAREVEAECLRRSAGRRVVFCQFSNRTLGAFGIPGAIGMPYENQAAAMKIVPEAMSFLATLRVGNRLSTVRLSERGVAVFSPGDSSNAFYLENRKSHLVSLGDYPSGQAGYYACVRSIGELTLSRAQLLFAEVQKKLGSELRELRIRNDAWFFDVDFTIGVLALAAFNRSPFPTPDYFAREVSILCRSETSCEMHVGLFRGRR